MPAPRLNARRHCFRDSPAPIRARTGGGSTRVRSRYGHEFTAGFLFCGLGAGARGFVEQRASLGKHRGRFRNVGGVDIDFEACLDFEMLSDGKALQADLGKVDGAMVRKLRRLMGRKAPDVIFLSPPCKGFSQLLPTAMSKKQKYQLLNRLVLQGLHLICETWKEAPGLLVIENVPGIMKRGAELLAQARQLLSRYGYVFTEATHDCGEVGGLAQHRTRYLLVARHPGRVPEYVYLPPKKRVRACGEVLGTLPLPGDPAAGPLHNLPNLSWLNWLRLALIPEGGDWRDLPTVEPVDEAARKEWLQKGKKAPGQPNLFKGKHGVMPWEKPARAVIGGPSNGASNVAQPLPTSLVEQLGFSAPIRVGSYGVGSWWESFNAVTGYSLPCHGRFAVAEPLPEAVALGHAPRRQSYSVNPWEEPFSTVRGVSRASNGSAAVAQPLLEGQAPGFWCMPFPGEVWVGGSPFTLPPALLALVSMGSNNPGRHRAKYSVEDWSQPSHTVTGATRPGSGSLNVADPLPAELVQFHHEPRPGVMGVIPWEEASPTITASMRATQSNTPASVAQPLPEGLVAQVAVNRRRNRYTNQYRVRAWWEAAGTVTGDTDIQEGAQSVAHQLPLEVVELVQLGQSAKGSSSFKGRPGLFGVLDWAEPSPTIPGRATVSGGNSACAVADPTPAGSAGGPLSAEEATNVCVLELGLASPLQPGQKRREIIGRYDIRPWNAPARTVAGNGSNGGYGVAQPLQQVAAALAAIAPRGPRYVVMTWQQAAQLLAEGLVSPQSSPDFIPVIIAADGKWHRPLTTLDLAALQGIPTMLNGKPLTLAGKAVGRWRERIGNAVPVGAGAGIAHSLLLALLAARTGEYQLGETGVWVKKKDGRRRAQKVERRLEARPSRTRYVHEVVGHA